jgi:2-haloacid dehalogenase
MLDSRRFDAITFDCYGTLVDWETGILDSLHPVLQAHGHTLADDALLERYAALEAAAEAGPYRSYREVLRAVVDGFGAALAFTPTDAQRRSLEDSLPGWRPFPDTVAALAALAARYRLAVISNVDDDLFRHTAAALGADFDRAITAKQVGAYKPDVRLFQRALESLLLPSARVLHAAQSLYHDIVPARSLGITAVWVQRRHASGFGATPPAAARADLVVPDLRSLAHALLG